MEHHVAVLQEQIIILYGAATTNRTYVTVFSAINLKVEKENRPCTFPD